MCGICGAVSRDSVTEDLCSRIAKMNSALVHRGPDGEGKFQAGNVLLEMRRLSIIDLSTAWQPLFNEDRSLALVVNGEIYNYVELREALSARGHVFSTSGDCETILHLYEEFGCDCVHHLRGMFAFALWDSRKRHLMLARDRMGEKPLYLYQAPGTLVFASEMKALLASGLVPFVLDPTYVDHYFHYQYVPEPATPLAGVRKLDAAHILVVDVEAWTHSETCYWRMEDSPPIEGDPVGLLRRELDIVTEMVIRSDVPVGVALSGGLDSSAIAALAARRYHGKLHAFSVGYEGRPPSDERRLAKAFARYLDLPFHEVELQTNDLVRFFPELVTLRDDPIADISGYGYYAVMKAAREQDVPVMLQGQGGDELFWGYGWAREAARRSTLKAGSSHGERLGINIGYLRPSRPPLGRGRTAISAWFSDVAGLRSGIKRLNRYHAAPFHQLVLFDLTPDFQDAADHARAHYSPAFVDRLDHRTPSNVFTDASYWVNLDVSITSLVSSTYLRANGVAQGDRLSMASSVELRLPLLDYRLVELVVGLRKTQSDRSLPPKTWLKGALRDALPDWVLSRPKRGFEPPVRRWHRALFMEYGELVPDGFLVQNEVLSEASSRRFAGGPFPDGLVAPLSFKALTLELWCRSMSAIARNARTT